MLINVKMPTTVGILTFISKINTTPEMFKAGESLHITFISKIITTPAMFKAGEILYFSAF